MLAVDPIPARLEMAKGHGAEVIDSNVEDPVQVILRLTGGVGLTGRSMRSA